MTAQLQPCATCALCFRPIVAVSRIHDPRARTVTCDFLHVGDTHMDQECHVTFDDATYYRWSLACRYYAS